MKLKALTASMLLIVSTSACAEDKQASDKTAKPADKQAAQTAPAPQTATPAATTQTPAAAPSADASATQKVAGAAADKPAADKPAAGGGSGGAAPYKVSEDGKKVDEKTYKGYGTYINVCVPCHGREATGGMGGGANLVESLKKLDEAQTKQTILEGKPGTLMAGFKTTPAVADNIDGIYAYLKGRSDGKIWGKSLDKM